MDILHVLEMKLLILGPFLDPIADKLLVAAVILILTSKEVIADWETIPALIILLREIACIGTQRIFSKNKSKCSSITNS
jgi:phosphatidylglycerophosphate synthase